MARKYSNSAFVLFTHYVAVKPNKDFTGFDKIEETIDGYLTKDALQKKLNKKYGTVMIQEFESKGVMYGFTASELVSIGHPVHPKSRQPWNGETQEERDALNEQYRLSLSRFRKEAEESEDDEDSEESEDFDSEDYDSMGDDEDSEE